MSAIRPSSPVPMSNMAKLDQGVVELVESGTGFFSARRGRYLRIGFQLLLAF